MVEKMTFNRQKLICLVLEYYLPTYKFQIYYLPKLQNDWTNHSVNKNLSKKSWEMKKKFSALIFSPWRQITFIYKVL